MRVAKTKVLISLQLLHKSASVFVHVQNVGFLIGRLKCFVLCIYTMISDHGTVVSQDVFFIYQTCLISNLCFKPVILTVEY